MTPSGPQWNCLLGIHGLRLPFTPYIQLAFIVPADPCLLSTASSIGSHLLYLTALTFLSTYIVFVTGVRSVLLPSESLRSRQGFLKAPQLFYSCTIHYTVLGTEPAFEAGLKSLFNDQYGWCEFLTARRPSQRSWKWCRVRCCYCRVLLPTLQADCAHKKLQSATDLVLLSGSLLHLDLCINVLLRVSPRSLSLSLFLLSLVSPSCSEHRMLMRMITVTTLGRLFCCASSLQCYAC